MMTKETSMQWFRNCEDRLKLADAVEKKGENQDSYRVKIFSDLMELVLDGHPKYSKKANKLADKMCKSAKSKSLLEKFNKLNDKVVNELKNRL